MISIGRSKQWKSFCGVDHATFESAFESVVAELDYEVRSKTQPGSYMLSKEDSTRYEIQIPGASEPATVRIYPATGDPLLRFLSSFRVMENDDLGGVCALRISIPSNCDSEMKEILRMVTDRLPSDPAEVSHHPRFRVAIFARWNIARKWRRWKR